MNYRQAMDYVEEISGYGIVPGLESIRELCGRIGNPQERLRFVHIAGTNGKGSTLAYISTILKCAGLKVGRYISPTIFEYCEKIQINGKNISKKALCEGMELVKEACDRMTGQGLPHPTPFEVETALAFWYFDKMGCDIVVLETGMGGTLDATNIIQNTEVAVLTSISMDHMQFLGKTLGEIAANKAGILKKGCQVVTIEQRDEAMEVVERIALEKGCSLHVAERECIRSVRRSQDLGKQTFDYLGKDGYSLKKLEIPLAGVFQPENALVAIETVRCLEKKGYPVTEKAIREGLVKTQWMGRFTVLSRKPLWIADGAHNEDAARKLAQSVDLYFTNRRIIYIMGMLRDKEIDKVIELTHRYADQIITITPPNNKRAMSAYELASCVARVHPEVTAAASLEEAVEMARLLAGKEDVILAFGSLSYLGRLMEIVGRIDKK